MSDIIANAVDMIARMEDEVRAAFAGTELLPCPFCGREPERTGRGTGACDDQGTGRIYFVFCHCGGYSARAHQFSKSVAEVAEKWNRRHPIA